MGTGTRPTQLRCACGNTYPVKPKGPPSQKCPQCRLPVWKRKGALRAGCVRSAPRPAPAPEPAPDDEPDRRGHTVAVGAQFSDDEREFLVAVDRYKRAKRRPFPALSEILAVLRELGWRKVDNTPCAPAPETP